MDIEAMVSKGYFPEEITPAFVTKDLANLLPVILNNIESYNKTGDRTRITKLISYSIPKIKAYRRTIGIPNPISFIWLSKTIIDHWMEITDFTNKSAFSLSRIHQNDFSNRAISPPVFSAITRERILRSTGFRYALKIDILRFYGNIYTHSIPWALHGKPLSKSKRKRTDLFGNALDEDVRNMQDGQTMGIPLGPDTSRVISEIIVSHIDVELSKQITNIKGIRVVDDYTLYFKTVGELELGRSIILKLLREFELDLNQAKEKVIDLPEQIESDWYNHLREFRFRNEHDLQLKDLIAYFDLSFFYSRKYPEESIITYSLSKISATIFNKSNWQILESFLLKSILIEPKVLPYVAKLFISHKNEKYNLDVELIKEALEDFLIYHLNLDNHFEVSWVLWLFKQLEITLSENVAKEISKNNNSIVALTALDVYSSGYIPKGLDTTGWKSLLSRDSLYNENWLFAYESIKKGWLSTKEDFISKEPFFRLLRDNNVEFYDEYNDADLSNIKVTSNDASLLKYRDDSDNQQDNKDDEFDIDKILEDMEF